MPTTAATFRQLHAGPALLLLANCWDAGSARLIESLGAPALATTSAGVAWALGYPDGDIVPTAQLATVVASIARVIQVPLSIDIEGGYTSDPVKVGELVARLMDAGAVGINIEDGADSPHRLAAKIECIKTTAAHRRVDFFVNARTDIYLRNLAPETTRIDTVLARARQYQDAGADGLFVPKVTEAMDIRTIASSTRLPLNVLVWPGLPASEELPALGVRRLSDCTVHVESCRNARARLSDQWASPTDRRRTIDLVRRDQCAPRLPGVSAARQLTNRGGISSASQKDSFAR